MTMRLSRGKVNHISHLLIKGMEEDSNITCVQEPNIIRLNIVGIINDEMKIDDEVDTIVRQKLESYSKKLFEGSTEWDIMYQKLYEEEMTKKGR
ncbi:MAG: DUF507 family protein [bacterium]